MFRPKSCKTCILKIENIDKTFYCEIGAFYGNKTILNKNVHSKCTLKSRPTDKFLTVEEGLEEICRILGIKEEEQEHDKAI